MHEESKAHSEVITLFEDFCISNTNDYAPSTHVQPIKPVQIWFGDTYRDGFSEDYLKLRDSLSDAAFTGNFDSVFGVLKVAEDRYGESWVNAPRLSKSREAR